MTCRSLGPLWAGNYRKPTIRLVLGWMFQGPVLLYVTSPAAMKKFYRLALGLCITINCPSNQVVECSSPAGAPAFFNTTATNVCDANVQVVCTPPSGSIFPLGTNIVTCNATECCSCFTNVCNTGMDMNGLPLAPGTPDPNYTLTPAVGRPLHGPAQMINAHPSWVPNGPNSWWIAPAPPWTARPV